MLCWTKIECCDEWHCVFCDYHAVFQFAKEVIPSVEDNVIPFSVYSTDCCEALVSIVVLIGWLIKKEIPTINKINTNPKPIILFILYLQIIRKPFTKSNKKINWKLS